MVNQVSKIGATLCPPALSSSKGKAPLELSASTIISAAPPAESSGLKALLRIFCDFIDWILSFFHTDSQEALESQITILDAGGNPTVKEKNLKRLGRIERRCREQFARYYQLPTPSDQMEVSILIKNREDQILGALLYRGLFNQKSFEKEGLESVKTLWSSAAGDCINMQCICKTPDGHYLISCEEEVQGAVWLENNNQAFFEVFGEEQADLRDEIRGFFNLRFEE